MEQLQREVQSLTDRLRTLQTGAGPNQQAKKRRRNRKAPAAQGGLGASQPAVVSVGAGGGGGRRRRRKGAIQNGVGTITLVRREMIRAVKIGVRGAFESDYIDIVPSNLSFLKQFEMFDRVRWNKLHLFYKPGVGANFNGFVSYGVLWGFDKATISSRSDISALTPNMSHAVWFDGEARSMVLPQSRLQTRPWFTPADSDSVEKGPGRIFVAAESSGATNAAAQAVGELWADYSVTLTGSTF